MSNRIAYGATVFLSLVALLLLVINITIITGNRAKQAQIEERQNMIAKGLSMSKINEALVQALADATTKNNDAMLRELLTSQGITIKPAGEKASADSQNTKK